MSAFRMRRTRLRALDGLIAGCGIVALLVLLAARPPSAQAAPTLSVKVSWSDAVEAQFIAWTNEFVGASSPVNFSAQTLPSDEEAKEALIEGRFRFVVAGSPLTGEEQREAEALGREIVAIPMSATGLVIGVRAPTGGWEVEGTVEDPPGSGIYPRTALDPIVAPRLSTSLIARLFTLPNVKLPYDNDFKRDMQPTVIAATNAPTIATAGVVRADPGALDLQLQRYIRQFELTYWQNFLTSVGEDVDYLDPDWPVKRTPSRLGRTSLASAVASDTSPEAGNQTTAKNGTVGIFTVADWYAAKQQFDAVDLRPAAIRNAAGEWVLPSPEAITAGIEAGITDDGFVESATVGDADATGAYPMTWVNWMLVPTTGVPPAELNAIANLARYAVTGGQAVQPTVGEPVLPAALVEQALATIDDVVDSNCDAANGTVRMASDPGPAAPPAASFPGITSFDLCDAPLQPAVTTTAAPGATTTSRAPVGTSTTTEPTTTLAPSGPGGGGSGGSRSQPTRRSTATTAAPTATSSPTVTEPPAVADDAPETVGVADVSLPYGDPVSNPQAYDRLATMAVGGSLAYGALRRFLFRSS